MLWNVYLSMRCCFTITETANIGTGRIGIEVRCIINGWETNHIDGKPDNHLSIQKCNIF
uniref:Uncharacterized protein n=1 Tax=Candidatus Criblamydia sequanensis CRIB-18 TaxID=1437425 RepID=A0A090D3A6_9BACT|nr:hypothetical protein CSEC_p0060 [Criblamydia sequanensis CRIB-18]